MKTYFVAYDYVHPNQAVNFTEKFLNFPQQRTAYMLGQKDELPYFNIFNEPLLTLDTLYDYIVQVIENTSEKSGWNLDDLQQIPIMLGSTSYVISDCEYRFMHNQSLPNEYTLTLIADRLQQKYQTDVFSFVTSCTSAAQGIQSAYQMIQNGFCDKALVVGFEMFNRLTFEHFHSMHLLAQDASYLPFIQSNGLILGEAMACVALSNQPHSDFQCEICHITSVTDSESLTNDSEQALQKLFSKTINNSQIEPRNIQAVKVHGVGGMSDEMEIQLLKQYFPESKWIMAKPYLGHTLGASGAIETAFLLECLQQGKLPDLPHSNKLQNKNLQKYKHNLPLAQGKNLKNGYYFNYFLGFGGNNVAWILDWKH
ncbi:beta-ketoacyl synthase N-terminal-like domain-containing protein [Pasteurella skyensis]|uniref:Beta-ketoacyl synthase N-terminal-like domain-containing protein n=1 Tax=Phocoenobacter skyensis TaxID=97481 RepID=A0AAJ6P3I5_9PAST|nr:beta-ketoacyl synthase N-terminal-like domain-containing protein [Pasteurella skyensis]MDP8171565.1 beta-ketoacyl synthase N-terminal-like domain-containing protein [Pasteurella skyensis]MDP8175770.1 beta-ketoacyl synthase N-terminal-like domain-containing protein [Pasteurella skyensis]